MTFSDSSSGGTSSAHLTNNSGGIWNFNDTSTAGAAIIVNDGDLSFNNTAQGRNVQSHQHGIRSISTTAPAPITPSSPIIDGGQISFNNTSTADHATITNTLAAVVFVDQSTAGNATINNFGLGATYFSGNSSAGSAQITNKDTIAFSAATIFSGSATASSATIVNDLGGTTAFNAQSRAGTAVITNKATDGVSSAAR